MSAAVSFDAPREREAADRRFRIRALPAGADWRALLRPSPPANDRPSGIALRTPAARDIPPEQLAAIDRAVRVVGGRFTPERRWDLQQDLAIKLLTHDAPPNVEAWCVTVARNLLATEARDEARRLQILRESHDLGAPRGYRRKHHPTWFSPHPDAEEFAPLACKGARVMQVRAPATDPYLEEDRLIARIDAGSDRARTPACPQTLIVEAAIQEKRTSVKKYAGSTPIRASLPERSNMTPNFEGAK